MIDWESIIVQKSEVHTREEGPILLERGPHLWSGSLTLETGPSFLEWDPEDFNKFNMEVIMGDLHFFTRGLHLSIGITLLKLTLILGVGLSIFL